MSIVYYSFADEEHASSLNKSRKWEIFPDTDDGHKQALAEGYTARSIYSFSIEPEKENNFISIRTGDLYLDIDGKVYLNSENKYRNAIDSALKSIRIIIETIKSKFDVDPNDLWYYASGGRGFHLVIPKEIIGSTHGDIFLPMIYKNLIKIISSYAEKLFNSEFNTDSKFIKNINTLSWLYIDTNLYKMGRGQLIRLPHIKRCNGKYKVPVTYDEIMNKDAEFFENIVLNDRNIDINYSRDNLKVSKKFETQFLYYKGFYSENEKEMNHLNTLRTIETNCDFIKYCIQNANDITELEWFCLARVLSTFKKDGLYLFHQISKLDSERYNKEEADKKFKHASNYPSVTCAELKDKNLCSKNCNVKCPIDLFNAKKYNKNNNYKYEIIDDWLVYMPDAEDPGSSIRVSSAIKVTAQARDEDSNSWSKIIELRDPDNKLHQILIENNKIACDKDNVIKTLTDNGLIISSDKKSKDRLMTYLNDEFPEKRAFITDKNGWIKNWLFCPHDLGLDISEQEYLYSTLKDASSHFACQGTLEDWKNNIGVYCKGNPLLQLAVVLPLAAPVLRFFRHAGFGVHLYGNSSCGKTTALHVARSVTGGQVNSWRATDNGLEAIALKHNDSCLILDELGQCHPDAVANSIYMLANGEGKARANKDGSGRRILTWLLNLLSSGELSISEKINQGYKTKAMAGHEVRVINIHADGGTGNGIFTTLPQGMTANKFSDLLMKNTQEIFGELLSTWIKIIQNRKEEILTIILRYKESFNSQNTNQQLTSQARRILNHFSLLSAVGQVASKYNLLPLEEDEIKSSIEFCFDLWKKNNKPEIEYEIYEAINKIAKILRDNLYDIDNIYKTCNYKPKRLENDRSHNEIFFNGNFIRNEICKEHQYSILVSKMNEMRLLKLGTKGNIIMQSSSTDGSSRCRGIVVFKDRVCEFSYKHTSSDI